jgi:hypothetical protein
MSQCSRCRQTVPELARYCARCGQAVGDSALPREGRVGDSTGRETNVAPLAAPTGFSECSGSPGIFFKWEAGWGGTKLLATETQVVLLFNAGPTIDDAELLISAVDAGGRTTACIRPILPQLPRGEIVRVEVPSYEIPDETHILTVALERCPVEDPTGRATVYGQ